MKFYRVYDVIRKAADTDTIVIRDQQSRLLATGKWFIDWILDMGDKAVVNVEYKSEVAKWYVIVRG